jgi:hypothetical protein
MFELLNQRINAAALNDKPEVHSALLELKQALLSDASQPAPPVVLEAMPAPTPATPAPTESDTIAALAEQYRRLSLEVERLHVENAALARLSEVMDAHAVLDTVGAEGRTLPERINMVLRMWHATDTIRQKNWLKWTRSQARHARATAHIARILRAFTKHRMEVAK